MRAFRWFMCGLLVLPLGAATPWPVMDYFEWNFTLDRVGPTTLQVDQLGIQLDANNRLAQTEMMEIRLYAGDSPVPFWSRDWKGFENGLNGLTHTAQDWDLEFSDLFGRLTLRMASGSVDLHRVTLSVRNGESVFNDSIIPDIRLVPEPKTAALAALAAVLFSCTRRRHLLVPELLSRVGNFMI